MTNNPNQLSVLSDLAVSGLPSPHTRRIYSSRIREYLSWCVSNNIPEASRLSRSQIQQYIKHVRSTHSPSTVNQCLSAIKKLAEEAGERDLLDRTTLQAIMSIKGQRQQGVRVGNWLTTEQARELLDLPDRTTTEGVRDSALLAVMVGCGLRRAEVARLRRDKLQQRWKRWVFADIVGKRGRVRTVAVPEWVKERLDEYRQTLDHRQVGAAGDTAIAQQPASQASEALAQGGSQPAGLHTMRDRAGAGVDRLALPSGAAQDGAEVSAVCRAVHATAHDREGELAGALSIPPSPKLVQQDQAIFPLTPSGIWWIVRQYARRLRITLAPHDLRRTYAALSREGGADIRQIQAEMGHSSLTTTERYLGAIEGLQPGRAAGDHIRL